MKIPEISLIVPLYNEEECIPELVERSTTVLQKVVENFEIICVNDGSTDTTQELLVDCHNKDNRIKILQLSANYGHQAAFTAGLNYAKGEWVVMMDGDLQDPPELIEKMLDKCRQLKCDVVYVRRTGRNETWLKKALTNLFHIIFTRTSKLQTNDRVGNFSLFNRKVLKALLSFTERNRYLPGLRALVGYKQTFIEFHREERKLGKPKYSLKKQIYLGMDAIFAFSDLPIKICLFTGIAGMIIFFGGLVYSLVSKLLGIAPFGWSSIIVSIYFLGSIQLVFLGIIGEYVFRIYRESQKRPLYFIDQFID